MQFKMIYEEEPWKFQNEVNTHLKDGWYPVPDTHVAVWKNVSVSSGNSYQKVVSDEGYFSIILQKMDDQ